MRTEHYIVVANTEISVRISHELFRRTIDHATENLIPLCQHIEELYDDEGSFQRITLYGRLNDDAIN